MAALMSRENWVKSEDPVYYPPSGSPPQKPIGYELSMGYILPIIKQKIEHPKQQSRGNSRSRAKGLDQIKSPGQRKPENEWCLVETKYGRRKRKPKTIQRKYVRKSTN